MKVSIGLMFLILVKIHAGPHSYEEVRSDVMAKLRKVLAEMDSAKANKADGPELVELIDVSDLSADTAKPSSDQTSRESEPLADTFQEFSLTTATQGEVRETDSERQEHRIGVKSEEEKSENGVEEDSEDSSKSVGAEVDMSDMNVDGRKESAQLTSDDSKSLETFRQAMASQGVRRAEDTVEEDTHSEGDEEVGGDQSTEDAPEQLVHVGDRTMDFVEMNAERAKTADGDSEHNFDIKVLSELIFEE